MRRLHLSLKQLRLAFIASMLGLSFAVTGCGQSSSTSSGKKTVITLWYWSDSLSPQELNAVSKQFPNVELKAEEIGGNFEEKLISAMYADDAPDITAINSDNFVATMVQDHDQFVNLLQYPEVRAAEKLYLPWKWNLASTPDHKYQVGIPIDTGPTVLYYNTKLFKEAGLPTSPAQVSAKLKTWSDYLAAAKQMKEKINVPMFDNVYTVYEAALDQGNQYYFNSMMKPIYATNPVVKNAWNLAVEIHQDGLVENVSQWTTAWSAAAAHDGFASFIGASWMVPQLEQSDTRQGVWKIAAAPGGPSDQGGSFLGVTKDSKHPELAAQIALWLMNPKNQTETYPSLGLYPSTPSSYKSPIMNQPSAYFGGEDINTYLSASAKDIKVGFDSPYDSTVDTIFSQALSLVALSNENPKSAWNNAVHQANQQLARELA
ncbi:extracellular solute-binding protein [Alicyclobacillus fastidiosus]|uniref:Extracellular solute-binding protein n=1 Tax=Alicyclobacillus fastidiosus TaxID=392011 RepID=A0ABY6ZMI5_9BACL|nr:extracellular solute-binding protein [Alicyclobacillus fastidiosus]WAH44143.1 extracellular solute-binding protein [Alicyclobacillus fastidiosus]GMA60446.1 ABC transporter substrate-binding protein [Alicyclobacillus fastidiosus]